MFKEILKKSFHLTWRNPVLWFLGFLTTIFLILTNQILLMFLLIEKVVRGDFLFFDLKTIAIGKSLPVHLIVLLFFTFFFILIISIFSENFLIFSLKKIKEKDFFNFKKSFKVAKRNVFPVLIVCLINFFIFSFFLWLVRLFREKEIFLFFMTFFWLLINLVVLFLTLYTIFYLVMEEKSIKKAFFSAFLFLKNNWLKTISLALILFFILVIFALLRWLLLELGLLTLPLRLVSVFFTKLLGQPGFWLMFFLNAVFIFLLQVVLIGFLSVYQTSCWVFFFLKSEELVNKKNEG